MIRKKKRMPEKHPFLIIIDPLTLPVSAMRGSRETGMHTREVHRVFRRYIQSIGFFS
jgi:hypothetical protein